MSRKILLFCVVSGFWGFLLAGTGLYYSVNFGVSLGRLAYLKEAHSSDLKLIKSVSLAASKEIDIAICAALFGLIFFGASAFLLGSLWMSKKKR